MSSTGENQPMKSHEIPEKVRLAKLRGDKEALSAMGKVGGKKGSSHRVQLEDLRKAEKERRIAEMTKEQQALYSVSEEGDVLPPEK